MGGHAGQRGAGQWTVIPYADGMEHAEGEIRNIRETIQFAMVVIIFFSTLIISALKATGAAETQADTDSLIWGVGVAFQIINYFLIGVIGPHLGKKWIRVIKGSIVIGILAFIDPIIISAAYSNIHLSPFFTVLYFGSFYVAFVMPIATCCLLFIGAYVAVVIARWKAYYWKKYHKSVKEGQREEIRLMLLRTKRRLNKVYRLFISITSLLLKLRGR